MLAVRASDDVVELKYAIRAAEERSRAAKDIRDPELRMLYGNEELDQTSIDRGTGDDTYRLSFRIFPRNPLLVNKQEAMEIAQARALVSERQAAIWAVAKEVEQLFAEWDYLEQDLALLQELLKLQQSAREAVKEQVSEGQATLHDVMSISRQVLDALSDRNKQAQELETIRRRLANLLGVDVDTLAIKTADQQLVLEAPAAYNAEVFESDLLDHRSDLLALYWEVEEAKAAYEQERRTKVPWIQHLQFSYSQSEEQDARAPEDSEEWRMEASVNVPLFGRFNRAEDVRLEEYRKTRNKLESARARAEKEMSNALKAYKQIEKARVAYRAVSEPIFGEMKEILERLEAEGALGPNEEVRSRRQLLDTERMQLKLNYETRLAIIRLSDATGRRLDLTFDEEKEPDRPE